MLSFNTLRLACAGISLGLMGPALGQAGGATMPLVYDAAFFAAAQPATAYDMVQRLPAFQFDDGANVRGFAGAAGNVLIDGARPTAKTDSLGAVLARIPASQVARIEVIRGGAPGIDMQGRSVVANVILVHASSTALIATLDNVYFLDGHDMPGGSVQLSHRAGDSLYNLTLQRFTEMGDDSAGNGYFMLARPGFPMQRGMAWRRGGEKPGWGLNADAALPLWGGQFGANVTFQRRYMNQSLRYGAPLSARYLQNQRWRPFEAGVNWTGTVAGDTELTVLALGRLDQFDYDNSARDGAGDSRFTLSRDSGEAIVRASLRYRWSGSLMLESGLEGASNAMKGDSRFQRNGMTVMVPDANARAGERRGEAFAQGRWTIAPAFALEAGVRWEISRIAAQGVPSRSLSFVKPRLLVTYTPDHWGQFRLRAEKRVGQLDFSNFVANADLAGNGVSAGNQRLQPARRWQFEAAWEYHFWGRGALVLSALHEQIRDLVDYVPIGAGLDGPGNIARASNNEYRADLTLPLDRLGLAGGALKSSMQWDLAAVADPVTGRTRGISNQRDKHIQFTYLQDVPMWQSSFELLLDTGGWSRPAYRIDQASWVRLTSPYVQARWNYRPRPDLEFTVEMANALPYHLQIEQYDYAGPRNSAPLTQVLDARSASLARLHVQLRKTF